MVKIPSALVDVGGVVIDPRYLAFISDSGSITVTGAVVVMVDGVPSFKDLGSGVYTFTFTLSPTTASPVFHGTAASAITGLTAAPDDFCGIILNFSGAYRWGALKAAVPLTALLADMASSANKTRYPLVDSELNNRQFGRIG